MSHTKIENPNAKPAYAIGLPKAEAARIDTALQNLIGLLDCPTVADDLYHPLRALLSHAKQAVDPGGSIHVYPYMRHSRSFLSYAACPGGATPPTFRHHDPRVVLAWAVQRYRNVIVAEGVPESAVQYALSHVDAPDEESADV